jgi:hypothetical protein
MFTFYDNLYGFEEKVWNICFNEDLKEWVTFYSWIPSYSENIYNQFFSFDRNTSKWIAKLGISNKDNDFSDGIVLDNNIIENSSYSANLNLSNRTLPTGQNISYTIEYSLERDNYGYYDYFNLEGDKLSLKNGVADKLKEKLEANSMPVCLLNIKASIGVEYANDNRTLGQAYAESIGASINSDAGYYESVVAIIFKEDLKELTTDFWKHGQSGIIDIADKIKPTYWYGK